MVALHQGNRADFVDTLALPEAGHRGPARSAIRDRLAQEWYDVVVTTSDVLKSGYDEYEFGLPPPLIAEVRRHYLAAGHRAGLFFYRRRGLPRPSPATTPARRHAGPETLPIPPTWTLPRESRPVTGPDRFRTLDPPGYPVVAIGDPIRMHVYFHAAIRRRWPRNCMIARRRLPSEG